MQIYESTERRTNDRENHTEIYEILLNVQTAARDIKDRVISIEYKQDLANSAFSKNDLGTVDYDGHRKDHLDIKKAKETVDKYKFEFTKSLLKYVAIAAVTLIFSGFIHKIALLVGIPGA